jgi:EAL and modified HD-GYP domain-containing signal transduction protein
MESIDSISSHKIDALVARQPIFNKKLGVIGYELLFRHSREAVTAEFDDADQAVSSVIINSFMEIGLERMVGNKLAFINMSRRFFLEGYEFLLPREHVVLEILENINPDREFVDRICEFSDKGYRIALDDVTDPDQIKPLIDVADIVKVDMINIDRKKLSSCVEKLKSVGVKLLAEKVETYRDLELCRKLGFDYFQGFFLSKPQVVEGHRSVDTHFQLVKLLTKLRDPDVEFSEIEGIISRDVSLSYKLLKLINSSYYSVPVKVRSVHDVLVLLGVRKIRSWLSLLILSKLGNKPRELTLTAMIRARMCELLVSAIDQQNRETAFLTGLFSVLDALLDMEMDDVLGSLPLSDSIRSAILEYEGELGEALRCVIAYERGEWEGVSFSDLDVLSIGEYYLKALDWAYEIEFVF